MGRDVAYLWSKDHLVGAGILMAGYCYFSLVLLVALDMQARSEEKSKLRIVLYI